ncbi:hypothetical protein [Draconibacterium orientale]|uniref:hypothetical protein n=1 Tax=Draconibacterium orientale TaxID=1168034 RepID=UPI0029BFD996|nr:hypothetical protein [Draconibacterium orientale]
MKQVYKYISHSLRSGAPVDSYKKSLFGCILLFARKAVLCAFLSTVILGSSLVPHSYAGEEPATGSPPVIMGGGDTQIIVDDRTDVIRFVINGETKAFLDARGFFVVNDLSYGGMLTDVGSESIKAETENLPGSEKEEGLEK